MDDYISKPVRMQEIFRVLDEKQAEKISRTHVLPGENPSDSPVVDLNVLFEVATDRDEIREILELYVKQSEEIFDRIEGAIQTQNFGLIKALSHKYAGSSASCGVVGIVPVLRELEQMGEEKKLDQAPEVLSKMKAEFRKSREFFKGKNLI